ncbi:hypothetical protein ABID56_000921 [Alkalibacillus flavidus]|uniref:Uncharacterized protein n=1 Tax=Alkalibacillus flavidus TaxID=546021 RepID=A0ABV2KTC3_9BACI
MNSNMKPNNEQMHDFCRDHHMHFVHLETGDGQLFDGIIDDVDHDGVILILPWGEMGNMQDERNNPNYGYGPGSGYGYGPGYPGQPGYGSPGRYPRRFRRFRRQRFPFRLINRILFPFFY